jgi:hypothetical protein
VAVSSTPPHPSRRIAALHAALEASRGALLAAIATLGEREFTSNLPTGLTVVATLAALAPFEREAIQRARVAIGAPERPRLGGGEAPHARALPPQVVHDLAGARYETLLFLGGLDPARLDTAAGEGSIEAELAAIAAREQAVAAEVAGRPRAVATPGASSP